MFLKVTPLGSALILLILQARESQAASYPSFQNPSGLILQADAAVESAKLRLTAAKKSQRGGLWLGSKQAVDSPFDTTFQFQITDQCHYGGNGFSFVIQNNATPVLGGFGHDAGFWGVSNLVAINFRTYHYSRRQFVKYDDITVIAGDTTVWSGKCTNCVAATTNVTYSDHAIHTARITYTPGELAVYLDNLGTPVLTASLNLAERVNLDNGKAWVGFTAATGGDCQNHDVLSWFFNENSQTVAQPQSVAASKPTTPASVPARPEGTPVFVAELAAVQPAALPLDKNFGHLLPSDVGLTHEIEASTDLVHWSRTTNVAIYFKDIEATNYDHRFYRFRQR
jgi:hypothetical protein